MLPLLKGDALEREDLESIRGASLTEAWTLMESRAAAMTDLPRCLELPSLTRPPVADSIDVLDYDISIDPYLVDFPGEIRGWTTIRLKSLRRLRGVDLHFADLAVESVHAQGDAAIPVPASFSHDDGVLHIRLPEPLEAFHEIAVTVNYRGVGSCRGNFAKGIVHTDRGIHTFNEPGYARHWFPCHDVPWDKATATLSVQSLPNTSVSATGVLTDVFSPKVGPQVYRHRLDQPVATYLIAFYIGDFVRIEDDPVTLPDPATGELRTVPVEYFTYPDLEAKTRVDFANTPDMLRFFSRFHPYPFPRYAMTVGIFGGGMEHQTNSLIGELTIRGDRSYEWLNAHETAHQWWGDLVTPRSWDDIWLNEGFATYFDLLFTEHAYGRDEFLRRLEDIETVYFFGDSIIVARGFEREAILGLPPDRIFSFTVYNKGAAVVHMLRGLASLAGMTSEPVDDDWYRRTTGLGFAAFTRAMQLYAERNAYGAVSTADLRRAFEDVYGQDLTGFFHQWLIEPGYPELEALVGVEPTPTGTMVSIQVDQVQESTAVYRMPLHVKLVSPAGDRHLVMRLEGRRSFLRTEVPFAVEAVAIDPDNWLLDRLQVETVPLAFPSVRLLAFPNPSPGRVQFSVSSRFPAAVDARLEIFDVRGRLVRGIDVAVPAGGADTAVDWDGRGSGGRSCPAGIYFARLTAGERSALARVLLLP